MRARFAALVLVPWLLVLTPLVHAQVRPGLAHRHDASAPATASSAAITHDSDADGALIGAAVGAGGLSVILYVTCDGGPCGAGVLPAVLIGGLAGLVVGGLLDAADPLTSPEDRYAAAPEAEPAPARVEPPIAGQADSAAMTTYGREPASRRNDLIGALIGAVGADLLTAATCSAISDTGGCPIFHPAYLPAMAIGALLGAGIGSAIGESADEDRE